MKDKELRKKFDEFQKKARVDHECLRFWLHEHEERIRSLEKYLGVQYEYVKPLEGKYIHRKVYAHFSNVKS